MYEVAYRDRAAYLPAAEALVVADFHVGRDEASGVQFPLGERADLRERLEALLAHFDPGTVVFAGDLLHAFGDVSPDAEDGLRDLIDACRAAGARPALVAGNHDVLLDSVWAGEVYEAYRIEGGGAPAERGDDTAPAEREDDTTPAERGEGAPDGAADADDALVCHGHEAPPESAALYVVGHDHPAIEIEGRKRPCYLYGPDAYRGGDVLMLPAFNRLTAGATVNGMRGADFQSPLVTDADAFRPIVRDPDSQETLRFPPLGEFRRML